MIPAEFATLSVPTNPVNEPSLEKGIYLCLLHAKRIPPHIGIIINGNYHSLTIKGTEPNVPLKALLKTISQKKIETIFLKIKPHPVFSVEHLNAMFLEILKPYTSIKNNELTCLSPLKEFFYEFYAVPKSDKDIIFTFINRLHNNNFILEANSLNLTLESGQVQIPVYSQEELNNKIKSIRDEYYND